MIIACAAGGMLAWAAVVAVGPHSEVFVPDWIVFDAAGSAYLQGKLALLFDAARFTAFQHETLARWYQGPVSLHPWLYPPSALLLLVPLALLPFGVSYGLFQLATGVAAVTALAWRGPGCGLSWARGIMVLLFPATAINLLTGQNGLMVMALLVGGMRLIERQPILGGMLLGVLTLKPHFWLMVPVALVALRAWRALAACAAAALLMVLVSAALFGAEVWELWIRQTVLAGDPALADWVADTFSHGYGIYVSATLAGIPPSLARWVQAAAIVAAGGCVWAVCRRPAAAEARIAVVLVAAIAAAPHVMAYDLTLLGAAAILLFAHAGERIGVMGALLLGGAWAAPLLRPVMVPAGAALIPAILAGLLIYGLERGRCVRHAKDVAAVPQSSAAVRKRQIVS